MTTTVPYSNEGDPIPFFTTNPSRIKFNNHIRLETEQVITSDTDPTQLSTYTVKEGDIWINTQAQSIGFVYIPAEKVRKHSSIGCRKASSGDNIQAADGGLWMRSTWWWERSPRADSSSYFSVVSNSGYASAGNTANYSGGLALGFSI